MRIIGVTGGIGSGKSEVTRLLEERHGFAVLRADDIAKELMRPGTELMEKLRQAFPTSCFEADGSICREAYAALIYSDPAARMRSDELVHPAVWQEIEARIGKLKERDCCIEAALPGDGLKELCTEVWFVYAEPEARIRRLEEYRGYTREQAVSIMENQLSDEAFFCLADYVVQNSGSLEETAERIQELLGSEGQSA